MGLPISRERPNILILLALRNFSFEIIENIFVFLNRLNVLLLSDLEKNYQLSKIVPSKGKNIIYVERFQNGKGQLEKGIRAFLVLLVFETKLVPVDSALNSILENLIYFFQKHGRGT